MSDDPLIGDELIRVQLEAAQIHFVFQHTVLQLGAAFVLQKDGNHLTTIDPSSRSGDLAHLWPRIGDRVLDVIWSEALCVVFSSRVEVVVPPTPGLLRGTIMGRNDMTCEDF